MRGFAGRAVRVSKALRGRPRHGYRQAQDFPIPPGIGSMTIEELVCTSSSQTGVWTFRTAGLVVE